MQVGNSLELAALVTFGFMIVLFIVDIEIRILAVGERVTEGLDEDRQAGGASGLMERSASAHRCWLTSWRPRARWTAGSTRCSSAWRDGRSSE